MFIENVLIQPECEPGWSLHLINFPSFLHAKNSFVNLPMFSQLQLFQRQTPLDASSIFAAFSPVADNLSSDHGWRSLEVEIHHPVINIPLSERAIQLFSKLLAISEKKKLSITTFSRNRESSWSRLQIYFLYAQMCRKNSFLIFHVWFCLLKSASPNLNLPIHNISVSSGVNSYPLI